MNGISMTNNNMVLEFMNDYYPYLFILGGLAGFLMGVNRALKSEEEESGKLKLFAGIMALLVFVIIVLAIWNNADPTNYSVLFAILFSMSISARPLKKIPVAFLIAILVGVAILYLVFNSLGDVEIFQNISLKWVAIAIAVIVLFIFIIGFFQEQILDGFLMVLGWGPIVVVLSLTLLVQGVTLLLQFPNKDGILTYLPG